MVKPCEQNNLRVKSAFCAVYLHGCLLTRVYFFLIFLILLSHEHGTDLTLSRRFFGSESDCLAVAGFLPGFFPLADAGFVVDSTNTSSELRLSIAVSTRRAELSGVPGVVQTTAVAEHETGPVLERWIRQTCNVVASRSSD